MTTATTVAKHTPATSSWALIPRAPSSSRWDLRAAYPSGNRVWEARSGKLYLETPCGKWFRAAVRAAKGE